MIEERYSFAKEVARRAGSLIRQGYGQTREIQKKGVIDLATEYDLRSEQLVVEEIQNSFSEDAILAEEGGRYNHGSGCWIIDPLDGTVNFAHGVPIFCVSIAYLSENRLAIGVIYDPMRDELFHACHDGGAWLGDQRLQVSKTRLLDHSLLVTGFPYDIRSRPDNNLDQYNRLSLRTRGVRRLGSAALDLAYVAAGRMDGYWELFSYPWDIAAGALMVTEARGTVSRADGSELDVKHSSSVVATNGKIHTELLDALADGKLPEQSAPHQETSP